MLSQLTRYEFSGFKSLSFKNIDYEQYTDHKLQILKLRLPNQYIGNFLDSDVRNITYYAKEHDNTDTHWRIYLPDSMLKTSVARFHKVLGRPGATRSHKIVSQSFCNS